jgi:hypothetical protein
VRRAVWKLGATATASILAIATLLASPLTVLASCVPPRSDDKTYYQVFVQQDPGISLNGVYSQEWNYVPYVPSGKISYGWVMLTKSASYTWAQVGNYKYYNGREVLVQFDDGAPPAHDFGFTAEPQNTFTPYDVGYGAGTFSFSANGVLLMTHTASWTPTFGQISSEINSRSAQLMGADYNEEEYYQNQLSYGGSWHTLSSNVLFTAGASTYFGGAGNGSDFQTWDKACTGE